MLPVFPNAQPIGTDLNNPTLTELETAETLITMHDAPPMDLQLKDQLTTNVHMELQEPAVMTVDQPCELIIESTPVIDSQCATDLEDAMDKVVNHEDISFTDPINWLKFRDCMDLVTGRVSELVESVNLDSLFVLDEVTTKPCRVELVRIKNIPTVKLPTLQMNQDLLSLGEYFTRSKLRPKQHRRSRWP